MGFIKKLFGKKQKNTQETQKNSLPDSSVKSNQDNMIRVHDEYGREMLIDKQSWLDNVLSGNLQKNRDNPDELYNLLLSALDDGFEAHIQHASARLFEIDPLKERGACIYAIVLMKNGKLDKAEKVLCDTMSSIGKTGVLLTNLAKVYAERGDNVKAEKILWNALEIDPNQDNGLDWFAAINHERGGKCAYIDALTRISQLDNAWRPKLWLARESLESGNKKRALTYYKEIFQSTINPDSQVLQQISGDLGLNGYVEDIINVVYPYFQIEQHGFTVGNNFIKAYIELQRYQEAKALVDKLFAQNRPDWKEGLSYWQKELDELIGEFGPVDDSTPPRIAMMPVENPIWLHKIDSADVLLPSKGVKPFTILTTSGTCSLSENHDHVVRQQTNEEGCLCRGVPLAICDRLNLQTNTQASMLVAVVENAGFAFFGQRSDDEYANYLAEQFPCDLVILPHLYAETNQWVIELRVFNSDSPSPVKTFTTKFDRKDPALSLKAIVDDVYRYVVENTSAEKISSMVDISKITPNLYAHYIDASESCLALSLACNIENGASTLYGERNIFDKLLHLALEEANSDVHKFMITSSLAKNKDYGSDIYREYETKIRKLFKDHPPKEPVELTLNAALNEIYAADNNPSILG